MVKEEHVSVAMMYDGHQRWVSINDLTNALECQALDEQNPKVRTKLFEVVENIRKL